MKTSWTERILTDEQLKEAKQLWADGVSQRRIAKIFGVSRTAVFAHIDPMFRKKHRETIRQWEKNNPAKMLEKYRRKNRRYYYRKKLERNQSPKLHPLR